jgi:hypothetical protein
MLRKLSERDQRYWRQAMEEEIMDINALKAWRELSPNYPLPTGEQWLPTKKVGVHAQASGL